MEEPVEVISPRQLFPVLSKVQRYGRAWPPRLATHALLPSYTQREKGKWAPCPRHVGTGTMTWLSSGLALSDPKLFLGPRPVYIAVRTGWASC